MSGLRILLTPKSVVSVSSSSRCLSKFSSRPFTPRPTTRSGSTLARTFSNLFLNVRKSSPQRSCSCCRYLVSCLRSRSVCGKNDVRNSSSSSGSGAGAGTRGKATAQAQKLPPDEEDKEEIDKNEKVKSDNSDKKSGQESRSRTSAGALVKTGQDQKGGRWKQEDFALPVTKDFFQSVTDKNKETFMTALDVFKMRDKNARGHVEFIYAALKHMRQFGVHRDLDTYKKIIDIFPKGRFVAQNMFQIEFQHYPKQQDCATDVLDQMEEMGVMPDSEMQILLTNVFGSYAFPLRKLMRMMYWMPKFKNLSPWPIPDPLPDDSLEIAKIAIQRITSVDLKTQITCLNTADLDGATDHTWIVSGQAPDQSKLIAEHPADRPIYVEGAFRVWISRTCINYFILRAEPKPLPTAKPKDPDDVGLLSSIFKEDFIQKEVAPIPTVHEQDDGVILAVCATGTSSRDTIISWLQFLEEANPRLGKDISILINLKSPLGPTDDLEPQELGTKKEVLKPQIGEDPNKFVKQVEEQLIGFDPTNPDFDQVGIGKHSDTTFLNWPHHFNQKSIQVRESRAQEKVGSRPSEHLPRYENKTRF